MENNQFDNLEKALKTYAKIAHKLPPPPDLPLLEPEDYCVCNKIVPITKFPKFNTGVRVILNNVCKDCPNGKKLDAETAKVVCCKCRRVVARLQPGKDPMDGFIIKAGASLHVMECPNCDGFNEGKECQIIEKVIWQKKNKSKRTTITE